MPTDGFEVEPSVPKLLNKLTVTELAKLSNLSKSYISQVKHGKCAPSHKLIEALMDSYWEKAKGKDFEAYNAINLFLKSRREGLSPRTKEFYKGYLSKAIPSLGLSPTPDKMTAFFNKLSCSNGGKHAYYRAMKAFYRWAYSQRSGFNLRPDQNPLALIDPPKMAKVILPSLSKEQVELLVEKAHCTRDKAIISLFTESGLRLSELMNVKLRDIDWQSRVIKVLGKGNKEGYAPFGKLTEQYLKVWLSEYQPKPDERIWNIRVGGIDDMLDQLRRETGLPCNPHTFRRTFACLLRKAGVDTMTIKDLGRWESLEMVQRYTRSISFNDSLKFYKAPLG